MAESGMRSPTRGLSGRGQAALTALRPTASPGAGSPMTSASPQAVQPHSGQSPSGPSGQLAGSAWNCSNSRSSPHSPQYLTSSGVLGWGLLNCVILATSSALGVTRGA